MAEIIQRPRITLTVDFSVSEREARALDALAGYGDDAFIKVFYKKLGKAYMEDHEGGLRQFLATVRLVMPGILSRTDAARAVFEGEKVAVPKTEREPAPQA